MGVEALLIKIDRVRDRERTVLLTAGLMKFVLAAIGLVAGFFVLDWLMLGRLVEGPTANRLARGVLLVAMAGTLVYVFVRCVWQEFVRELDDDEVALRVEARHPDLGGRLISTIQLTRDLAEGEEWLGSEELIEALEADTVSFAGALNFADIINLQTLKKVALAAVAFALLSAAMGAWRVDYAKALLGRMLLSEADYPTATRIISVTPGCVVARGEPHEVDVELDPEGYLPQTARLVVRLLSGAGGGEEFEYEMVWVEGDDEATGLRRAEAATAAQAGVVYRGRIERVMEDLEYRAFAHDARSVGWEDLRVLRRPAIRSLELTYAYPAYTGKPGRRTSVGDIRAIEGTQVEIVATLAKPVVSASLLMRAGALEAPEPSAMQLNEEKTGVAAALQVESDGYYRIELADADGLGNRDPIEYVIDAVRDKAPSVKLTFPGRDKTVTRFAVWPIRFEARDDFGITRGWLRYRVGSADEEGAGFGAGVDAGDPREAPAAGFALEGLVRAPGQREVKAEAPFDLQLVGAPGDIRPGSRLTYWIEIADNRTPEHNVGRSRAFEFVVAEAEEVMFMIGTVREEALSRIDTIIRKQEETKDGVDDVRRKMRKDVGR